MIIMSELVNHKEFDSVITIIKNSQIKAVKAINKELILLYWSVGAYISTKIPSKKQLKKMKIK